MLKVLTFAAIAATSAQAFLIPSTISSASVPDAFKNSLIDPSNRIIKLDCENCPFLEGKNDKGIDVWSRDVQNSLVLDFKIPQEDPSTITINGVQVYPHKLFSSKLAAPQIPSIVSLTTFATESADDGPASSFKKLPLGFELAVERAPRQPENTPFEILNLHFKVLELESIFVKNLDSVEMTILKSLQDGRLMLAKVETKPSPANTAHPIENAIKECRRFPLLCKWKAMIAARFRALRAKLHCGGWRIIPVHMGRKPGPHGEHAGHQFGQFGPGGPRHGDHLHKMLRVAVHVLLPIFIGLAAGMTASLLGMIVGHLIVLAWRRFGRRGQQGVYSRVEQNEPVVEDEKAIYLAEAELPPYQEVAVKAGEVNEKH